MGYDNGLLAFYCDAPNDRTAASVLGSLRSLRLQRHLRPVPYPPNHNHTQQTNEYTMVDREVTTNDRDRECMTNRFGRNLEVRYLESILGLRDKLKSLACTQEYCPMIKERLQQHQRETHSSGRAGSSNTKVQKNGGEKGSANYSGRSVSIDGDLKNNRSLGTKWKKRFPQAFNRYKLDFANMDRSTTAEPQNYNNYPTRRTQSENNTPKRSKTSNVDNNNSVDEDKRKSVQYEDFSNSIPNIDTTTSNTVLSGSEYNKGILKRAADTNGYDMDISETLPVSNFNSNTTSDPIRTAIDRPSSISNNNVILPNPNDRQDILNLNRNTDRYPYQRNSKLMPGQIPKCLGLESKINEYIDDQISHKNSYDSRASYNRKRPFINDKSSSGMFDDKSLSPSERRELLDRFDLYGTPTNNIHSMDSVGSFKRRRSYDMNKSCCSESDCNISPQHMSFRINSPKLDDNRKSPQELHKYTNYDKEINEINDRNKRLVRDLKNRMDDRNFENRNRKMADGAKKTNYNKCRVNCKVPLDSNKKEMIDGLRRKNDFDRGIDKIQNNQLPLNTFSNKNSEDVIKNGELIKNKSNDECLTLSHKERTYNVEKTCCDQSKDTKTKELLHDENKEPPNKLEENNSNPKSSTSNNNSQSPSDNNTNSEEYFQEKNKKWVYPSYKKGIKNNNKESNENVNEQTDAECSADCPMSNKLDSEKTNDTNDNNLVFKSEIINQPNQSINEPSNNKSVIVDIPTKITNDKSSSTLDKCTTGINETDGCALNVNKQTNSKNIADSQISCDRKRNCYKNIPFCSTFDNSTSFDSNFYNEEASGPHRNWNQDNSYNYNKQWNQESPMCNDFRNERKLIIDLSSIRPPSEFDESYRNTFGHSTPLRHTNSRLVWNNSKNSKINLIRREVQEWILELPMYPGLGKEAKEDIENVTNILIRNLNNLPLEISNAEFERRAINDINLCLNKLPIWYSGYTKDQSQYADCLVDRLLKEIKYSSRREDDGTNPQTSYSQREVYNNDALIKDQIRKAITSWLWSIYLTTKSCKGMVNEIPRITDFVYIRVSPLLTKPVCKNNRKLLLKSAIVDVLKNMLGNTNCSRTRDLRIYNFADDLTNGLLAIQANISSYSENKNGTEASTSCFSYRSIFEPNEAEKYINCKIKDRYERADIKHNNYPTTLTKLNQSCEIPNVNRNKQDYLIFREVRKCFENAGIDCNNMVIYETGIIMVDFSKMPDPEGENDAKNDIINLLVTSTNLSEAEAYNMANTVIKKVKYSMTERQQYLNSQKVSRQSNSLSVFTSIEQMNYPITSKPKKKPVKKEIPKLNLEEIQYMENVANLIRVWMDTLPENFSAPDEQNFKETMINDLAGDIMDEVKLEQLAPGYRKDRRKYLKYYVCRWAFKLRVYDIEEIEPQIENFLDKLQGIPVPVMTKPQHGNRQVMEYIKHIATKRGPEMFLPKGADILEDEISIWVNEQPSNLFTNNDKAFKNKKVHELAQVLQTKLENKRPQTEISQDVAQWLTRMIKPEEKQEIGELTENLKDRVIGLPQDATLGANFKQKTAQYKAKRENYLEQKESPPRSEITQNETFDQENTMKMFISKYIEHNYDIDDPLARRAVNRLLKTHLLRLSPPTRKEIYDNFGKRINDDRFPSQKLIKELEYIKYISDWLKKLPIDRSFNTIGNRDRIEFVNSLALSIYKIEEERSEQPDAMDYNLYMATTILEFLQMLPIPKEHLQVENLHFMVDQLFSKLIQHRQDVINKTTANESLNTTGVNSENIGDFIEEFIRINGDDIAEDEVKLEAWAIRLIKEIKNIIRDTSHPDVLSKGYVYDKLAGVSIPGDETANLFSLELSYVNEISNWMKNLPLSPINNQSEEDDRVEKVCKLAQKIVEIEVKNPSGIATDTDFKEYLTRWITELSLQENQEIPLTIVFQQLINRLERVKKKDEIPNNIFNQHNLRRNTCRKNKKRKSTIKPYGKSKDILSSNNLMVNVIEQWSYALPIKADNENATTYMKQDISRKLSQKVGQLNMDPRVFNDDLLYTDILTEEIDNIFENIPQSAELEENKEDLKFDLVDAVIDIKNDIKNKTAGDMYKFKLENMIEASIPNPARVNKIFDPGFEIYKERLATMFILENYDHGTDAVKMKYLSLLKQEVDKYFKIIKCENMARLSKDEIYNELYSALFKVPIPNEASVINEVKEIKTKCELDNWFGELPMKEADGLFEALEWDKILSTLAKRINEIETVESKPDQKILKEIMKWIVKLPMEPGYENQLETFAKKLQNTLKHTADHRKCVLDDSKLSKRKKGKGKAEGSKKSPIEKCPLTEPTTSSYFSKQMSKLREPKKIAADIIFETVQKWCYQLPIIVGNTPIERESAQVLKDSLTTKIIIRISDLNINPQVFNDDNYYEELLDKELDKLLSVIPLPSEFYNEAYRKSELIEAVKSIRPLILEERDSFKYKQDLNKTVDKILEKPQILAPEKESLFSELRNDIVDDFIQYKYDEDDDEGKQNYKTHLEKTIAKYNNNVLNNKDKKNTLFKTNQLICELSKIPAPYETNLRGDVDEIKMRKEVADFFDELSVPNKNTDINKTNYLKTRLAKKLNDIEMNGYTPENESKMKQEITKSLSKFGKKINTTIIDKFISKLRNNEKTRRLPQYARTEGERSYFCQDCLRVCQQTEKQEPRMDSVYLLGLSNENEHIHNPQRRADFRRFIPYGLFATENDSACSEDDLQEDPCYCRTKIRGCHRPYYNMVLMQYSKSGRGGNPFWY